MNFDLDYQMDYMTIIGDYEEEVAEWLAYEADMASNPYNN